MAFRSSFWAPILVFQVTSTLLFFRLYYIILHKRKQPQYGTFFFKMFLTQSLLEVFFIHLYVLVQMVTRDFIFGDQFVLDVTILPHILYFWTFHYFVYSQIWSAVMISVNRYVVVCRPMSSMDKLYQKLSTRSLALINVIVPFLLCTRLFFQPLMYYYRSTAGLVQLYSDFGAVNSNSIQSLVLSTSACLICAICYVLIIRRLLFRKKMTRDSQRREFTISIVGFSVFIALCLMTGFFAALNIFSASENEAALVITRTFNIHFALILTFINPWMLFITDKNLRWRVLFLNKIQVWAGTGTSSTARNGR